MQNEISGREIARNRKARIDSLAVHENLIMIPAKPGADGPIPQSDQVLDKCGLLKVRPAARIRLSGNRKDECRRSARRKSRRIGDDITEIFVQKGVVRLDSEFPFVAPVIDGNRALEVAFAKPASSRPNRKDR
jgi:hypothetical protein